MTEIRNARKTDHAAWSDKMKNFKRQRLLVQIAKLYYEEGYGQERIAQTLNLSRPYVSKLLNAAKEEGIVRIQVIDPLNIESSLEREFRERFHLLKAIIIPREEDGERLKHVGEAAARYLSDIITDGSVIGASWGGTVYECSKALISRKDLSNVVSVQLCGGVSDVSQTVYASQIADNFSALLGASAYMLPVPAVVDSKEVSDVLKTDGSISKVLQRGLDADIALFTAGTFGQRSALYRAGYLRDADLTRLKRLGAVGDICSHVIDINGKICDRNLDERTMAVPLDNIKKKKYRIGVGQGFSKVDSLCGALRGGIINVLVTNEETAECMLDRLDRK